MSSNGAAFYWRCELDSRPATPHRHSSPRPQAHKVDSFPPLHKRKGGSWLYTKWRGIFLDFVNLITTMPSRHSGDQVHKVDFSPIAPKGAGM